MNALLASLRRIAALMRREARAIWQDRRGRFVLIVPPILQLFIFSYAATFELHHAPLAVLNEDMGVASRDLVARFTASEAFKVVAVLTHADEIAQVVENQKALAVLRIGSTFSRDLLSGKAPSIQLIVDGRHSNTALIALSYVNGMIEDFSLEQAAKHGATRTVPRLVARAWFNPNLNSQWFIIPGMVGILTMMIALTTTAMSVARERELGTFEQLLVTPLRPMEIMLGKIAAPGLIALAEGFLLAIMGIVFFGVPFRGDLLMLVLGLAVFLTSVTSVGLMLSTMTSTQQQALIATFCIVMPCVVLSGFITPIDNMPDWVQVLTYANPVRYIVVITRGVFLQDIPWSVALANIWPMAAIGVVTGLAAMRLFRSRVG